MALSEFWFHSSSASRVTADAAGFLTLTQQTARPPHPATQASSFRRKPNEERAAIRTLAPELPSAKPVVDAKQRRLDVAVAGGKDIICKDRRRSRNSEAVARQLDVIIFELH